MKKFLGDLFRGFKVWAITLLAGIVISGVYWLAKMFFNNTIVATVLAILVIPVYFYLIGLMAREWLKVK